jgi:hypothetical protein
MTSHEQLIFEGNQGYEKNTFEVPVLRRNKLIKGLKINPVEKQLNN